MVSFAHGMDNAYFCLAQSQGPSKRPHRRQGGAFLRPVPLLSPGLSVFLLCKDEH
jgi:hypothetical protein